jgi:dipeptidyl aminopeptidase/acylaminoacyl peptidase
VLAENLPLLNIVSHPALHPDRPHVVVAVTRPDFAADAYVGQLWRVPLDGAAPRRITRGFRDTRPQFSADGRLLGFLRADAGKPPQLAIVGAEGGEPMVVTDAPLGVRDFVLSADGTRAAFIAAVAEQNRYGTTEGVPATQEDPRLIRAFQFQLNGTGYTADQRTQVFVVDLPDPGSEPPVRPVGRAAKAGEVFHAVPAARQLSNGGFDHHSPAWDGEAVLAIAARHKGWDDDLREDVYRFALDGSEPVRLTDSCSGRSANSSPVVVGDQVFFVGFECGLDGRSFFAESPGVYVVSREGGAVRRLTDLDGMHVSGDLVADGDGVLTIDLVRGRGVAIRVDASGEAARWELPGSVQSVAAAAGVRVAVLGTSCSPGEVVLLDRPEPALTDFAAGLRDASAPLEPIELVASASDGHPVHGWVVRPDGEGPHPVLLVIHGGPFSAFEDSFFDEAQVYAAAGYAVVMCNPRGSAGYGRAHAMAIHEAFGDRDAVDVLAFLDHVIATVPGLAADRVGIMGGSYGGYLTAWLIAGEHRFSGAIVERAYLDPASFVGPSDIGWFFAVGCHGDRARMDAQSPLRLVDQVRTPTLVIHSEQDLRCPLATAERYYTELKLHGVDTALLVFPGESHELSRSGSPHHRKARFEHILTWWGEHLPVG